MKTILKKTGLILIILLTLFKCKKNNKELTSISNKNDIDKSHINNQGEKPIKSKCEIPKKILDYFKTNIDTWELIKVEELNIQITQTEKNCLFFTYGDFNQNKNKDFAVIARNKEIKIDGYGNNKFPYLLIFNDYETKKTQNPFIISKTKNENARVNTLIYDQFENGILSYIKNIKKCNTNIVEIVLPEKSSVYVFWNEEQSNYGYSNVLDFDCKKITDTEGNKSNLDDSKIVSTYMHDLNLDGIKDKIIVYENKESKDNFGKKHFSLPIKILKGDSKGFSKWVFNENLIFSKQNNCYSEGFQSIIFKNEYFTIEQTFCSRNQKYAYTTFKFDKDTNELNIHKYVEEIIQDDDAKAIPPKVWTKESFGEISFNEVSKKTLTNIRQKDPK